KQNHKLGQRLRHAWPVAEQAIALADDVTTLVTWLGKDVLGVNALDYASRSLLYDFIVAELRERNKLWPHRIDPVCRLLETQRDHLLAFAVALDDDVQTLARQFQVSADTVREALAVVTLSAHHPQRWQREAGLRRQLGERFYLLEKAVRDLVHNYGP